LHRRSEGEQQRREHANAGAHRQNAPIDLARQIDNDARSLRRKRKHQCIPAPVRDDDSTGSGEGRENQAFGQELLQQTAAACAERETRGHLRLPHQRPDQKQRTNIRARNQKDEQDNGERDLQCRQHFGRDIEGAPPQRQELDFVTTVGFWIVNF